MAMWKREFSVDRVATRVSRRCRVVVVVVKEIKDGRDETVVRCQGRCMSGRVKIRVAASAGDHSMMEYPVDHHHHLNSINISSQLSSSRYIQSHRVVA